MTAKEFIVEKYPVTAKDFENKECAGLYDIAYICEKYHESKVKNLGLFSVSQRSELFFAVLKWTKQADLDYPDEMLLKDFEQFTAKNCG